MLRKVIKQGNDTLTITLPRRWARKQSISPGDNVIVEEDEKEQGIRAILNLVSCLCRIVIHRRVLCIPTILI